MKAIAGVNLKKVLAPALLVFVVVSVAYAISAEARREPAPEAPPAATAESVPAPEAAQDAGRVVRAYYFHSNQRCVTCRNIETHSRSALEESFPEAIEGGSLVWTPCNIDEAENRHYVQDFQLSMPGVVLAEEEGGRPVRYANLAAVWQHARTPERLRAYVTEETAKFLGEAASQ